MNELALFAGIHGIGLGLKRAFERRGLPFRTVCYVEWDDYCVEVLRARMRDGLLDDAPIWGDITTFDGRPWAGCVDIVTGGFPCQDLSFAGRGAGLEGERSGLFYEMWRIVREVRPKIVLMENSTGLLGRGMDRVAAEVASSFYDIQGDCISAHAFGSPQVRERLFFIAYRDAINGEAGVGCKPNGQKPIFTNGDPKCSEIWVEAADKAARMDDGIPGELYRQRVEVLGNAVVPQVAEYVGERLIEWLDSGG